MARPSYHEDSSVEYEGMWHYGMRKDEADRYAVLAEPAPKRARSS